MLAQEQEGVKEKLLVIPQCTRMTGLVLKPNRTNRHEHRMTIGKNHARTAKVAVDHAVGTSFPVFTTRRFKNQCSFIFWFSEHFPPFVRIGFTRVFNLAGISKSHGHRGIEN